MKATPLTHTRFPIPVQKTRLEGRIFFPNYELAQHTARNLLIRSLQTSLHGLVWFKTWHQTILRYDPPYESNRSGCARALIEIQVSFQSSTGPAIQRALAHMLLDGGDDKQFAWIPNGCGSYICIDGKQPFEIHCDVHSGNIELRNRRRSLTSETFFARLEQLTAAV